MCVCLCAYVNAESFVKNIQRGVGQQPFSFVAKNLSNLNFQQSQSESFIKQLSRQKLCGIKQTETRSCTHTDRYRYAGKGVVAVGNVSIISSFDGNTEC